jgi:dihydropteroate synthase
MGILNITPDSFYAQSRCKNNKEILQRAETIIYEGGNIIDIGACSSRPGAVDTSSEEEIGKLMPALNLIRKTFPTIPISVDTYRSDVAQKVIKEGEADIINDISGGEIDSKMFDVIAELNVPYILTHIKGNPQTMQDEPYYENVMSEIMLWFAKKVELLRKTGVKDIIIDPGFGFGKTIEHNFILLKNLKQFKFFELPVMVGLSRKSMISKSLGITPEKSLNGTTVLNTIALLEGANILRVHDVKETQECVNLIREVLGMK